MWITLQQTGADARISSGDCGVCVVQEEATVRFGRCCCQVHGVAAPRLNFPEPQRQLLAEQRALQCFCKQPHTWTAALSMPLPGTQTEPLLLTIACCIFPYGRKKSLHLVKGGWEIWWEQWTHSDPNSFSTCWVNLQSMEKSCEEQGWVTAVQMEVCGVVCHCQTQRGGWRALELRKTESSSLDTVEVQHTSLKSFSWHTGCDVQELLPWARGHTGIILLFYMVI